VNDMKKKRRRNKPEIPDDFYLVKCLEINEIEDMAYGIRLQIISPLQKGKVVYTVCWKGFVNSMYQRFLESFDVGEVNEAIGETGLLSYFPSMNSLDFLPSEEAKVLPWEEFLKRAWADFLGCDPENVLEGHPINAKKKGRN